jgi:hypothetical protein
MIWASSRGRRFRTFVLPCPPVPMIATFTFSLGGTKGGPPNTCLGTILNVATVAAAVLRK